MITVLSQPGTFLQSAGNESNFTVSSSNVIAPNVSDFQYTANIYINGKLQATQTAFPDANFGYGTFPMKPLVQNFLSYNFPHTESITSIFSPAPSASCQVQVFFGEQYTVGTTFSQSLNLASSSVFVYLNSALTYADGITANMNNYVVTNATSSTVNFLTNFSSSLYAYPTLRNHLYYYISSSTTTLLSVKTFDSNNNQLGNYFILDQSIPYNGVQFVSTGYPQLSALTQGTGSNQYNLVSGQSTMFAPNVVCYQVYIGGAANVSFTKPMTYTIKDNSGRWQNYITNCYFLNEWGGFSEYQFQRKNQYTIKKSTSQFKKSPGSLQSNGQVRFNTYDRQTSNYFTQLDTVLECCSDWLSNQEALQLFRSLQASPVIYLEDVNGLLQAANVQEDNYPILNSTIKKGVQVKFTFVLSSQDYRQTL